MARGGNRGRTTETDSTPGEDQSDRTQAHPGTDPADDFELLDRPHEGVPDVVDTPQALAECVAALRAGTGPIAVDAERASGFRYGQRAYLIQLRRAGSGTWLVDPIPLEDLSSLAEVLDGPEWVLHAATQDLPCLTEIGLRPRALFDTELGSRLAGLHRVGLSAAMEYYLGVTLSKEHSAVDWSTRPLPEPWLRYAALDVELLVELRDRMERDLAEQGKLAWAREEFEALCTFTGPRKGRDLEPWRRTSGASRVRKPRNLAALRELWQTRDDIARERDVASAKVLPDSSLIDLATRMPRTASALPAATPDRSRSRQRRAEQGLVRHQRAWLEAIRRAGEMPEDELPSPPPRSTAPPPARSWADRDPEAAARLLVAKDSLAELSEQLDIPVENILTPESVRQVLWRPPSPVTEETLEAALVELEARPWQRDLVVPILLHVLSLHP
ncbi:ribonuclease D [Ornithinimicrobium panacihumi]|uniref:ribonuclease D n=1 Tax=Ornithinimicrobium panacihumi TaxID=2008449 RepID=UPI003F8A9C26